LGVANGLERLDARLVARNRPQDAVVVELRGELAKADGTLAVIGLVRLVGNLAGPVELAPLKRQIRGRRPPPMAISGGLAARKIT